jgi:hypothetical protein
MSWAFMPAPSGSTSSELGSSRETVRDDTPTPDRTLQGVTSPDACRHADVAFALLLTVLTLTAVKR